ncbi:MAG TPA: MarR family winged helix-turn-helix transcriptional regulator [Bacillota bacterium]|nr:MarR family winged helix-turn-helix transcriptional regulator [Bacillota bacterium]
MKHIEQVYPKSPSPCNCMNIRRASLAVTQFYEDILRPCGLTVPQFGLLIQVDTAQLATISELAKMMRIDRTTLNRNLKPLIDAGLITTNPGQDSRTRQIMLTQAGKDAITKGWELWGEAQTSIQEYLGDEDLAKLVQLLSKLEALVP